jgi:hypothetical protein
MRYLGLLLFFLAFLHLPSCATRNDNIQIEQQKGLLEDKDFSSATQAASRQAAAVHEFETQYFVNATYFSPAYASIFKQGTEALYLRKNTDLDKYADSILFFVSIFVPESTRFDLKDTKLWTIKLRHRGQEILPLAIEFNRQKEYFKGFFPFISHWSKEYFITFPRHLVTTHSPNDEIELIVANADAKTTMSWKLR